MVNTNDKKEWNLIPPLGINILKKAYPKVVIWHDEEDNEEDDNEEDDNEEEYNEDGDD